MNIERIREAYEGAVARSRDARLDDSEHEAALDELIDLRHELDRALIGSRQSNGVSRDEAARVAFGGAGAATNSEEVRSFLTPGSAVTDLWVRPGREETVIPGSEVRTSFLTSDTATIGSGYYFVDSLYKSLVTTMLESSGVLEAGPTIITTDHVRPIQVPYLTADATAVAGTEGSAASDANPTGAGVDMGAYRWDGKFSVSAEMLMSSELPLEQLLTTFAQRSLANKVAQQLAMGTGSATSQADGLFYTGIVPVGKTSTQQTDLYTDDLIECFKALGKGYRKQAHVVVSDVLHTSLLQRRNDAGDFIFHTLEGGGETFMGKPMHVEPQADQTSMSAAEVHAVMGDFAGYFVRFGPFFFRRSDSDPLNPEFSYATWLSAKLVDQSSLVSCVTAA
jgi:HK97 family phage major capsid protein